MDDNTERRQYEDNGQIKFSQFCDSCRMRPVCDFQPLCWYYRGGKNEQTDCKNRRTEKILPAGGEHGEGAGRGGLFREGKEFVAIIGRSGSGKSTLLHMIGGLDSPTEGEVYVDGKRLSGMNREQLAVFRRRKAGFIFQNYNLIPDMNVYDNIVLPVELDGKRIDQKFVKEILELLQLEEKLDALPGMLSGGQQQRVAIARAVAAKPSIILADEPTGNLDTVSGHEVMGLLKVAAKRFQQTVILITHDNDIAQMADRIVHIEDGKIVGTYNECPGQKDCGGNLGHNAGREKAGEQHAGE